MPGKRVSHSEERWQQMEWAGSPIVRCVSPTQAGTQCKREALAGSIVCDKHGAHLPNMQRRAKERYVHLADQARDVVETILNDPKASDAAKLKAAEMVMKASGMEEAKKVVVDIETDPVEKLFRNLLGDPDVLNPRRVEPAPAPPAIETGEVVHGEVLDAVEESQPVPENVRPLNGWTDLDQPRRPSIFDAPATQEEARQKARMPRRIRETYDDSA